MGVFDTQKKEKSEKILETATENPPDVSVNKLDELVDDPNPYVRQNISHAVAEVAAWDHQKIPDATIDKIIRKLDEDKDTVYPAKPRGGQLHALSTIANEDTKRIVDAKESLKHIVSSEYKENHIVAGPAAVCLGAIGREGYEIEEKTTDNIIELLGHDDQQVRWFAIKSLQMLDVEQARNELKRIAETDPNAEVQSAAQDASEKISNTHTNTDTEIYTEESHSKSPSYCPSCGSNINEYNSVEYCPHCGTSL